MKELGGKKGKPETVCFYRNNADHFDPDENGLPSEHRQFVVLTESANALPFITAMLQWKTNCFGEFFP